jgi:hypothetical protein
MEHHPHSPEQPHRQSPEEVAQFQYESRLQQKLAERAYPNEPVPLMKWAENEDGYSSRFREWLEDPSHAYIDPNTEEAVKGLLDILRGPTLH